MFSFQWPWFALLMPLPLLLIAWRRWRSQVLSGDQAPQVLNPRIAELSQAFSGHTVTNRKTPRLPTVLLLMAWLALIGAVMRPQWVDQHTNVTTEGYDLMLAVDLSGSMRAMDFTVEGERVNRLSVIKGVLQTFIQQRSGDRVGLVLFGDDAYLQSPLTADLDAVQSLLMRTRIGMAGDATAIGDAIGLTVKKLRDVESESKVLILLTDGANTAGAIPPREAAKLAANYNIRIYTIGVGSHGLVPFPDRNGRLRMVKMELDEQLLNDVAQVTGGRAFRATDTSALEQIYAEIDRLEKTESESRTYFVREPLFRYFLIPAMVLILFARAYQRGDRSV